MYKCPYCQSTNCEILTNVPANNPSFMKTHDYNDNLAEFICNDCGIITKIDPRIYKEENPK